MAQQQVVASIFEINLRTRTVALISLMTLAVVLTLPTAQAQTFNVLYSFTGGLDGSSPWGQLAMDRAGNFYTGTMEGGNDTGSGAASKLEPASGGWLLQPLYDFDGGNDDGVQPQVVVASNGVVFGSTQAGGPSGWPAVLAGKAMRVLWLWPALLMLAVGCYQLTVPDLWRDELSSWSFASRPVPDDAVRADHRGTLLGRVHDRAVLDRRPLPHLDQAVIPAQHRSRPYRSPGGEFHRTDHHGVRMDKSLRVDHGRGVVQRIDRHSVTPPECVCGPRRRDHMSRPHQYVTAAETRITRT